MLIHLLPGPDGLVYFLGQNLLNFEDSNAKTGSVDYMFIGSCAYKIIYFAKVFNYRKACRGWYVSPFPPQNSDFSHS